ncbi:MAG: acetylxylan esterase [Proteobacteria bacterium]|nr:acetylxylan esterase [Pseudomonadota bacterium]
MLFMKPESNYVLPDLLKMENGTPITDSKSWEQNRRPEILNLFADRIYGRLPDKSFRANIKTVNQQNDSLNGAAIRREVTLTYKNNNKTVNLNLLIYQPRKIKHPVPVFVGLNFKGNHTINPDPSITLPLVWKIKDGKKTANRVQANASERGSKSSRWPVETILERGYALITLYYGDADPDFDDGFQNGIHPLFYRPGQTKPGPGEWGSISAWAWSLSRVVDYLATEPSINNSKVIAIGHSRLGKTALWAGALDERFAMVVSNNSGCMGAAISRRKYGETIEAITGLFPHWFTAGFGKFANRETELPVDQHQLISLIAPRPVYVASADNDLWADPKGEFLGAMAASPVYELYNLKGLNSEIQPWKNAPPRNHIGYHLREGSHDLTLNDWEQFLSFADYHLFQSPDE